MENRGRTTPIKFVYEKRSGRQNDIITQYVPIGYEQQAFVRAEIASSNRTSCWLCLGRIPKGKKRLTINNSMIHLSKYLCSSCAIMQLLEAIRFLEKE
jgi:hypothetical protein